MAASETLLPAGVYWQSGDASSKTPYTGQGWVLTTLLTDGVAGADTSTRVTSTTDTISILHVDAAPFVISGHGVVARYKGAPTPAPYEWDGAAFIVVPGGYVPLAFHIGYTDEFISGIVAGTVSTAYHLFTILESDASGGFMSASDSRTS